MACSWRSMHKDTVSSRLTVETGFQGLKFGDDQGQQVFEFGVHAALRARSLLVVYTQGEDRARAYELRGHRRCRPGRALRLKLWLDETREATKDA